jgi:hypothetical protein
MNESFLGFSSRARSRKVRQGRREGEGGEDERGYICGRGETEKTDGKKI